LKFTSVIRVYAYSTSPAAEDM